MRTSGLPTLLSVKLQRVLSSSDQRLQGGIELAMPGKETIHDHFLIARRQHAPQLPPPSIASGIGKIAFRRKRCLFAAEVYIQDLPVRTIVMAKAATVRAIDLINGLLHLGDLDRGAGIRGLLHHRLLRAALSSKGTLQSGVGSQQRIDFYQPMCSRKPRDEAIVQLVQGCMLDGLLRNMHLRSNGFKHLALPQDDS